MLSNSYRQEYERLVDSSRDSTTNRTNGGADETPSSREAARGRCVTVEPVIWLYYFCYMCHSLLLPQYIRVSVREKYVNQTSASLDNSTLTNSSAFESSCHNGGSSTGNHRQVGELVQTESAQIYATLQLIRTVPSLFVTLFHGGCSDRLGRVLPITLPLIGGVVSTMVIITVVHFKLSLYGLIVAFFLDGLAGGGNVLMMASFAYISDISDHSGRSLRISILDCTMGLSCAVGSLLSGFLIKGLGYLYPFNIIMMAHVTSLIYVLVFLKETVSVKERVTCSYVCTKAAKMTWSAVKLYYSDFRLKQKHLLLMSLLVFYFRYVSSSAESSILTLYQLGAPFCWGSVQVGLFQALYMVVMSFATVLLVAALGNHVTDEALVILGLASTIAAQVTMGVATTTWVMWFVVVIHFGAGLPTAMMRGLMSKLIGPNEQGALFASVAVCESVAALTGNAIIAPIYAATISFMRGFAFLVLAAFMTVAMFLTIALALMRKRAGPSVQRDIHN